MSLFRSFSQVLRNREDENQPGVASAASAKSASGESNRSGRDDRRGKSRRHKKQRPERRYLSKPKQRPTQDELAAQRAAQQQSQQAEQARQAAIQAAQEEAQQLVQQAQAKSREILIEAKSEALQIREQAEKESRELQNSLINQQKKLDQQLSNIDNRLRQVDKREEQLDKKVEELETQREELLAKREELVIELEKASGLTRDEAKQEILERLGHTVDKQAAQLIRDRIETAKAEADEKAKEILVDAMKHGATDYVSEYTISVVSLADADMKGRIIGKDGRNIRAFERATGVDVELDESPDQVRLSCFDPVRREVARISLERLLRDGRIQPTRIDEVVAKVNKELEKVMFEEGRRLCHKVGIYNMPNEVMGKLGRFKYRFSYGQNLIQHTLEETQIGIKLANELGLNVRTVTMGCLLHDIGKVIEGEGNHVELGVRYLQKHGFPKEVVDCVAQHHEDEPFTSLESVLVYISDAISGSRPGARNENHEEYIERLSKLEEIADSYEGVEKSFAIQAGREVRVILKPDKSSDRDVNVIATEIAERYQNELTYPGTVTVNVIREVRGNAVAK